jgi:hypothetical protein
MNGTRLRRFAVLLVTVLCTATMLLACAPNNSATPNENEVDEVEIKTTDPLAAFENEYEAISKKVEEGSLRSEVMGRASEIRMGLQKYLIRTEAQLEILRLDVVHGTDGQRETALSQIVELVAEREQTKISYLQQLQAVKTGGKPSEDKTIKTRRTGEDLDIEIKIAPENIGDGEWP